jgi:hypothetical protein
MAFLTEAANRGSIGGYEIDNSLKFESDNSENLTRTPSSASNQKTWTWSGWVKYTEPDLSPQTLWAGGTGSGDGSINFRVDAGTITVNTASTTLRSSTAKFRDPSAWYHFVLVMDTTQSTANDRVKVYVNGSQITDFSATNNPSLNADMGVNSAQLHALGRRSNSADRYFSGYMAEVNFVDGTSLAPTAFGEFDEDSGIWKPKAYTGSYGTNGFYLDFESSGSLGADSSGNGNNFTLNNITSADQATDTPTNNFCTLNILDQEFDGTNIITDGATNVRIAGSGSGALRGTYAVSQGKWYWEMKITPINTSTFYGLWGIYTAEKNLTGYPGSTTGSWGIYGGNGNAYYGGSSTTFYTDSIASGDIFSFAFNADDGQLFLYKNGSIIGANSGDLIATSGTSFPAGFTYYSPTFADGTNSPEPSGLLSRFEVNFGGFTNFSIASGNSDANGYGTFEYAPPSGYYALCSKNLAEYG